MHGDRTSGDFVADEQKFRQRLFKELSVLCRRPKARKYGVELAFCRVQHFERLARITCLIFAVHCNQSHFRDPQHLGFSQAVFRMRSANLLAELRLCYYGYYIEMAGEHRECSGPVWSRDDDEEARLTTELCFNFQPSPSDKTPPLR